MIARCYNPNLPTYIHYGGRGIRVCERWYSFAEFLSDMGQRPSEKHSLDRIDNNGDYEPGNCRWATRKQQNRNKRDNIILLLEGRQVRLIDAVESTCLSYGCVRSRLVRGKSITEALTTPAQPRKAG